MRIKSKGKIKKMTNTKKVVVVILLVLMIGAGSLLVYNLLTPKQYLVEKEITEQTPVTTSTGENGTIDNLYTITMALITPSGDVAVEKQQSFATLTDVKGDEVKEFKIGVDWKVTPHNFKFTEALKNKITETISCNVTIRYGPSEKYLVHTFTKSDEIHGTDGTLSGDVVLFSHEFSFDIASVIFEWYNTTVERDKKVNFDPDYAFYIHASVNITAQGVDETGYKWRSSIELDPNTSIFAVHLNLPSTTITPTDDNDNDGVPVPPPLDDDDDDGGGRTPILPPYYFQSTVQLEGVDGSAYFLFVMGAVLILGILWALYNKRLSIKSKKKRRR